MNELAPLLCPICHHMPLTLGRVCRTCMGLEDEFGNPMVELVSSPKDTVYAGILFEADYKPEVQQCSKCHKEYPLTTEHFHRASKNKSGFNVACKQCRKAMLKTWVRKKTKRTACLSPTGHVKAAICPICRKRLAPWQKETCGDPACILAEQRAAKSCHTQKPCRRCGHEWPSTTEYYYRASSRADKSDTICIPCRREEANQRNRMARVGVRAHHGR